MPRTGIALKMRDLMRLRDDALRNDMSELALCYGWNVLALQYEYLAEQYEELNKGVARRL